MKITDISIQAKNKDRVNVSVDGKYRFSLDIFQVGEIGIKVGNEYTEDELSHIENESTFGKLYSRALEYCLIRPHSMREVSDYLRRKTLTTRKLKSVANNTKRKTSKYDENNNYANREVVEIPGVSKDIADRVLARLIEKGYVDDEKFARFWVENRNQAKGISSRKLIAELRAKGIEGSVIEGAMHNRTRGEKHELQKVIDRKRRQYPDDSKLIAYLARQGFAYDDIKSSLAEISED